MKNYLLIFVLALTIFSCKDSKPDHAEPAVQEQTNSQTNTTKKGNTITQKVTVGGNATNTNIDVEAAMAMMEKDENIKVLDVRTPGEISKGSYPNSIKIDYNSDKFKSEINKLDKNDTYIVYCKSGGRSKKAVSMMKAFGFSKAYNMKDGFEALDKASK